MLGDFFGCLYSGKLEDEVRLERISSAIFYAGRDHLVRYQRNTHYMDCSCADAILQGRCEFMDQARKILESEGCKVVFKRVNKLPLDEERAKFKVSVERVIGS